MTFIGCKSVNEHIGPITLYDIHEANFIEDVLSNAKGSKRNFKVSPGSTITTVRISSPNKPANEEAARASMKTIKNKMRERFGREPNMIRMVFKDITIDE